MPVELRGSCHCGKLCLCSICRKVGGVGGSINLGAHANTLKIDGKEHVSVYKAILDRDTDKERLATSERNFCSKCSSMLWLWDETWPDLLHPFASAIDSKLEPVDSLVIVKNNSKPEYVRLPEGEKSVYEDYGEDSIEGWHKKHNMYEE